MTAGDAQGRVGGGLADDTGGTEARKTARARRAQLQHAKSLRLTVEAALIARDRAAMAAWRERHDVVVDLGAGEEEP